jgi:hypothetical protein
MWIVENYSIFQKCSKNACPVNLSNSVFINLLNTVQKEEGKELSTNFKK